MINLSGSHPLACITGLSSRGDNLLCAQTSCQGAWLLPPGLVDPIHAEHLIRSRRTVCCWYQYCPD
jgi:hypothetical protein